MLHHSRTGSGHGHGQWQPLGGDLGQERGGGCSAGLPSANWLKKCHLHSEILTQVLGEVLLPGWGCQWADTCAQDGSEGMSASHHAMETPEQPCALHIHAAFPKAGGTQEVQPQHLALCNDGAQKEEEPRVTVSTWGHS